MSVRGNGARRSEQRIVIFDGRSLPVGIGRRNRQSGVEIIFDGRFKDRSRAACPRIRDRFRRQCITVAVHIVRVIIGILNFRVIAFPIPTFSDIPELIVKSVCFDKLIPGNISPTFARRRKSSVIGIRIFPTRRVRDTRRFQITRLVINDL